MIFFWMENYISVVRNVTEYYELAHFGPCLIRVQRFMIYRLKK